MTCVRVTRLGALAGEERVRGCGAVGACFCCWDFRMRSSAQAACLCCPLRCTLAPFVGIGPLIQTVPLSDPTTRSASAGGLCLGSILSMLFCFWPAALVSLVFSMKARYSDSDRAQRYLRIAKRVCGVSRQMPCSLFEVVWNGSVHACSYADVYSRPALLSRTSRKRNSALSWVCSLLGTPRHSRLNFLTPFRSGCGCRSSWAPS